MTPAELGMTTFPLKTFVCSECNRNLGTNYDRLMKRKVPDANHVDNKCLCNKCYYKYLEAKK